MRKLRKAALVAAMIGSLSMAGAGVASATDYGKSTDGGDDIRQCLQKAEAGNEEAGGLISALNNLNVNVLGVQTISNTAQNSCVIGDDSFSANFSSVEADENDGGLLNLL
ncbi:hypothetical protein [Streptomyces sp. NPDC006527]|jgi:hypothetical protein|uniref:hypothetical protein n=1 Tax=Streptomyces sp. NPDC006527 TaxID=3364749 RepID=UPI0036AEC617